MEYGISVFDLKVGIDVKPFAAVSSEQTFGVDCTMNFQ